MNEEKRNNRLQLLNEQVDLHFLLRNFGVQIIPLQIITFFFWGITLHTCKRHQARE